MLCNGVRGLDDRRRLGRDRRLVAALLAWCVRSERQRGIVAVRRCEGRGRHHGLNKKKPARLYMPCSLHACGDGFEPKVFGPVFWRTMHLVAHSFPIRPTAADAKRYARFFHAIADVLPCMSCRAHFARQLARRPFPKGVPTRRRVALWMYRQHNAVTKRVNPHKSTPEFAAVEAHYARLRGA